MVAGVSVGTATSGILLGGADGWELTGVVPVGVTEVGGVVLLGGIILVGGVDLAGITGLGAVVLVGKVILVGALEGGVTVAAGVTIPIVRLVAHNRAIMPGLTLLGFIVSAYPLYEFRDYC